jgi:hypothetical protein
VSGHDLDRAIKAHKSNLPRAAACAQPKAECIKGFAKFNESRRAEAQLLNNAYGTNRFVP